MSGVRRCHSPFKHYLAYHESKWCSGDGYINSVLGFGRSSTTYNININDGGFWGGFKNGLGISFGNFIGGFIGGIASWIGGGCMPFFGGGWGGCWGGGFDMIGSGGWGGGFDMFGGGWSSGMSWLNGVWGGGGGGRKKTKVKTQVTDNNDTSKDSTAKCQDKDQTSISNFIKRSRDLKTAEEALKLYNEIAQKKENLDDDSHSESNKKIYDGLLESLAKSWKITKDKDGNPTVNGSTTTTTPASAKAPATTPATTVTTPAANNGNTVKIDGKDIDPNQITLEDLQNLSWEESNSISQQTATDILTRLGYIEGTGDDVHGLMSINPGVLLLLEKSNVIVYVENRDESDDPWIKGNIAFSEIDEDGMLNFTINCEKDDDASFKGIYLFNARDNKNKTFKVSSNTKGLKVDNSIVIKYQGEKQPLINDSDHPLVTKK